MKLTAWRLVREARTATAFDGEGARLYGGRWNPVGMAAVYTSEHVSLAALETLVHTHPLIPSWPYCVIRIEFDSTLVEELSMSNAPKGWAASPASSSVEFGGRWIKETRSAVLSVPSAIVALDRNFVLNPRHADFARISISSPKPFHFDPRLHNR